MTARLRIDPIACRGHGICAEVFPEWIELDDWGYPIIDRGPIPDELLAHARRAAQVCPKLALMIASDADAGGDADPGGAGR